MHGRGGVQCASGVGARARRREGKVEGGGAGRAWRIQESRIR